MGRRGDVDRDLILTKVLELTASREFASLSTKTLAHHCGITESTLFRYFPKKSQIFDGIIEMGAQSLYSPGFEVIKNVRCPYDRLLSMARLVGKFVSANQNLVKTCYRELIFSSERLETLTAGYSDYLMFIENALKEGIELGLFRPTMKPEILKYAFITTVATYLLREKIEFDRPDSVSFLDFEDYIEEWFKELLSGCGESSSEITG